MLKRLKNDDNVKGEGKFFNKGVSKKISAEVKKLSGSGSDYEYAATICDSGELKIYLEWNSESEADYYRLIKFMDSNSQTQEIMTNLKISKDDQTGLEKFNHLLDGQIISSVSGDLVPYRSAVELQTIEANKFSYRE